MLNNPEGCLKFVQSQKNPSVKECLKVFDIALENSTDNSDLYSETLSGLEKALKIMTPEQRKQWLSWPEIKKMLEW